MEKNSIDLLLSTMKDKWPSATVARVAVPEFTGKMLTARTMANLDCLGQGPKDKYSVGRKVFYTVDSLIEWLRERIEP